MSEQPISIHYQQMEEWLEDRKAVFSRKYKKPYTELLSIAPRLVQLAQYDIPAMEKQIKKSETAIEECHRVGEEAERTQQKLRDKRAALLEEYSIEATDSDAADIARAVDSRVNIACQHVNRDFQAYASAAAAAFKKYYNAFLEATASGHFGDDAFALHFPWLQRAQSEADFTLPDTSGAGEGAEDGDEAAGPQIDWGDDDGAAANVAEPDGAVQINWDATEMEAHVDDDEDALPPSDGQHFSIDLSLAKHRIGVLGELQAVSCFCRERGDHTVTGIATPSQALQELLTNSKEAEFARMRGNFRAKNAFLDRVDRFEQQIMIARNRRTTHEAKMHDAEAELSALKPQYAELLAKTTAIRDEALACLRSMFPDRRILIVGDLNKYIS